MRLHCFPHFLRYISLTLAVLVGWYSQPKLLAETPLADAPTIDIVIIEGEGAVNNIKQRTAREPIVEVDDENHRPVAGAVVTFFLPGNGASGTFANGLRTLTVTTGADGRATATGFQPNNIAGRLNMRVNATFQGQTVSKNIVSTNAAGGAAGAGSAAGISTKLLITIIAVAGAAAVGGAVAATRGGGGNTTTPGVGNTPTVITPGTPTVGGPH